MRDRDGMIDYAVACGMLFGSTTPSIYNVHVWPSITISRIYSWIELHEYTAHTDEWLCSWWVHEHEGDSFEFQHCTACSEFMAKLFPAHADVFTA